MGKIQVYKSGDKQEYSTGKGIAHNFVIGVDFQDDLIWLATSKGLSRGRLLKDK